MTESWYGEYVKRQTAFLAAHPRLHCPKCHKRVSPSMDTIIMRDPAVVACPHCGEKSEIK